MEAKTRPQRVEAAGSTEKEGALVSLDHVHMDALINALNDGNGLVRQSARFALVSIGKPAVGPLIEALANPSAYVRWEATKALGEIGDPSAVPALVGLLTDPIFDVRWAAAQVLPDFGLDALPPLLHALIAQPDLAWLRQCAHHVLRVLADRGYTAEVAPVLAALASREPVLEVPVAAEACLDTLAAAGIYNRAE